MSWLACERMVMTLANASRELQLLGHCMGRGRGGEGRGGATTNGVCQSLLLCTVAVVESHS